MYKFVTCVTSAFDTASLNDQRIVYLLYVYVRYSDFAYKTNSAPVFMNLSGILRQDNKDLTQNTNSTSVFMYLGGILGRDKKDFV
jgi:hypothetical protein